MLETSHVGMWPRLVARIAIYDLLILTFAGYFWVELVGAADPVVLGVLALVRFGLVVGYASALLEPVRRWEARTGEVDDRELLAVDEALDRAVARLVPAYVLGWIAILLASLLLAAIGVPVALPLGDAELLIASLIALGLALTVIPVFRALVDALVDRVRAPLGAELAARKLSARRPATTIVSSMLALHILATAGIFIGVTAIGGMVRVKIMRETELAQQTHRVELAALEQRAGLGELDPSLTIVRAAELPEPLRPSAQEHGDALLGATDIEAGETLAAAPLGDGRYVLARAPTDEQLGVLIAFLVTIALATSGPLAGANLMLSRGLANKLRELRSATRRVVENGELASVERVVSLRNDEVGLLINDFNGMLDVFEELTAAAKQVADGDLRIEVERPGDLHDAFRSMVRRLGEMVVEIRTTAAELASAAAQIHAVTRAQEQAATQQSASIREVGATAASLASAAKEIAVTAGLVLDNADRSLTTTEGMIAKIGELTAEANGVGDLLETIREVADRSDLLALNGSLEATRAGEAGRGFALVAAEMRRLAERVNAAAIDIRERVKGIERAGTGTVIATEEAKQLAERTATAAQQISAVTGQQSRDTEQVSHALEDVTQAALATAAATAQTSAAAQQLEGKAATLEQLTKRFVLPTSPAEPG